MLIYGPFNACHSLEALQHLIQSALAVLFVQISFRVFYTNVWNVALFFRPICDLLIQVFFGLVSFLLC